MNSQRLSFLLCLITIIFAVISGFVINRNTIGFADDRHFIQLAESFLRNDLYLDPLNLPPGDYADYKAKQYIFFGPMPAIILVPFVYLFGEQFPQIFLSILGIIIIYISIYSILKRIGLSGLNSFWLANFFVFGTVLYFVSLVNISAYLVQVVGVAFVCLAILEYFGSKRLWLIGILIAFAAATRITLLASSLFFLFEILRLRHDIDFKKNIYSFVVPILVVITLLGWYNHRRFNSFFDTGYTRNVTVVNSPTSNSIKGPFSLVHVPGNLYNLLIAAPEANKDTSADFVLRFPYLKANGIGLSILFTSPLIIYLLKARKKPYTYSALIASFALLAPSLVYFGIGTTQYGYRYSLDFQPFLFLILVSAFEKGLDNFAKFLIFLGIVFNCLYMLSIWNTYPLFFWL